MNDNVVVHKGGKLEKRQFLAKMHPIAPNCISNLKIFPGVTPRSPIPGEGWGRGHPLTRPLAPRLVAFGHSMVPLTVSYSPLKQTPG